MHNNNPDVFGYCTNDIVVIVKILDSSPSDSLCKYIGLEGKIIRRNENITMEEDNYPYTIEFKKTPEGLNNMFDFHPHEIQLIYRKQEMPIWEV